MPPYLLYNTRLHCTGAELIMTIGWYPGHMHKARKDITQALQQVDAVIEIVDARLPYSSENPILNKIIGDKPRLRVMSREDLADPLVSQRWLEHYQALGLDCLLIDKDDAQVRRQVLARLLPQMTPVATRPNRIMVVGIPNVGKSTLINLLAERKIARVGNEPAVTKARQEIRIGENLVLFDTPGILWPKLDDQAAAYRLAISGAIRNTAIDLGDVGMAAVAFLQQRYPTALGDRYQVDPGGEPLQVLERIGRVRGCLVRGGVDYTKAGEVVLNDLRSGKLGRLSLEVPEDIPPLTVAEPGESHDTVPL
jgi:ribosome biogenesis GTPase A